MPDTDTIERRAKEHPEVAEQMREADEAVVSVYEDDEVEEILVDGKQLTFEGFDVEKIVTAMPGRLKCPGAPHFKTYSLVELKVTCKVNWIGTGEKDGLTVREQLLKPISEPILTPVDKLPD